MTQTHTKHAEEHNMKRTRHQKIKQKKTCTKHTMKKRQKYQHGNGHNTTKIRSATNNKNTINTHTNRQNINTRREHNTKKHKHTHKEQTETAHKQAKSKNTNTHTQAEQ